MATSVCRPTIRIRSRTRPTVSTWRGLWRVGDFFIVVAALLLDLLNWPHVGAVRGSTIAISPWIVAGATAAAYGTLLLRRQQHPWAIYLGVWTFSLAGLALPAFVPFAGLLVGLHAVASRMERRRSTLALVLAVVPIAINAANSAADRIRVESNYYASLAGQFALFLVVAATIWGIGRVAYAAAIRAEADSARETANALRAERVRLARELHDVVSHAVNGMLLHAASARRTSDEGQIRRSLAIIETQGVHAMTELDRLLGLLRKVELGTQVGADAAPGVSDVAELIQLAQWSGMDVTLTVKGQPLEVEAGVDLTVYRVVQESLTNAQKYAGPASKVTVQIQWSPGILTVEVEDHRKDFGADAVATRRTAARFSSGLGLVGLRERVRLIGGQLTSGPTTVGYRVLVELPVVPRTTPAAAGRHSEQLWPSA